VLPCFEPAFVEGQCYAASAKDSPVGAGLLWVPSVLDGPSLVSVRATSSHFQRSQMSMRAFSLRSWSM